MIVEKAYRVKRNIINTYKKYFTVEYPQTYVLSDKSFIKKLYKKRVGKDINLSNPQTFTEKLNWLKLYDRNPIYTVTADKYLVRDFVSEKIGEDYLVPLLGVWDRAEDIDFSLLPEKYVFKCNHNSDVIICVDGTFMTKDKLILTKEKVKEKLNGQLKSDYYKNKREWPYKNIPRKIICEKYMENCDGTPPVEYKVFCFNGNPKYVLVISDRFAESEVTMDTYDMHWNHTNLINGGALAGDVYEKPDCFGEFCNLSQKLSVDMPFMRVDFNFWNGKLYFGEMTNYDSAGFEKYKPEEWDYILGQELVLPKKRRR